MRFSFSINVLRGWLHPGSEPAALNLFGQTVAAPSRRFTFWTGSAIQRR
jgi:hypothetical protein